MGGRSSIPCVRQRAALSNRRAGPSGVPPLVTLSPQPRTRYGAPEKAAALQMPHSQHSHGDDPCATKYCASSVAEPGAGWPVVPALPASPVLPQWLALVLGLLQQFSSRLLHGPGNLIQDEGRSKGGQEPLHGAIRGRIVGGRHLRTNPHLQHKCGISWCMWRYAYPTAILFPHGPNANAMSDACLLVQGNVVKVLLTPQLEGRHRAEPG